MPGQGLGDGESVFCEGVADGHGFGANGTVLSGEKFMAAQTCGLGAVDPHPDAAEIVRLALVHEQMEGEIRKETKGRLFFLDDGQQNIGLGDPVEGVHLIEGRRT